MADSVFNTLNSVNCNEHTEKKNGLTYLSWAWAWAEVKKRYPQASYTVYENADGWNYFTDGRTCWVKTGVTVEGLELVEYLPVMDFRNASIPADKVTSFDVNKAIQRSLTKACARHGLGLYIYAGEDLPEEAISTPVEKVEKKVEKVEKKIENPTKKAKPVIMEGTENWQKALTFCMEKNYSAEALRRWYDISDADVLKMNNIISLTK